MPAVRPSAGPAAPTPAQLPRLSLGAPLRPPAPPSCGAPSPLCTHPSQPPRQACSAAPRLSPSFPWCPWLGSTHPGSAALRTQALFYSRCSYALRPVRAGLRVVPSHAAIPGLVASVRGRACPGHRIREAPPLLLLSLLAFSVFLQVLALPHRSLLGKAARGERPRVCVVPCHASRAWDHSCARAWE